LRDYSQLDGRVLIGRRVQHVLGLDVPGFVFGLRFRFTFSVFFFGFLQFTFYVFGFLFGLRFRFSSIYVYVFGFPFFGFRVWGTARFRAWCRGFWVEFRVSGTGTLWGLMSRSDTLTPRGARS